MALAVVLLIVGAGLLRSQFHAHHDPRRRRRRAITWSRLACRSRDRDTGRTRIVCGSTKRACASWPPWPGATAAAADVVPARRRRRLRRSDACSDRRATRTAVGPRLRGAVERRHARLLPHARHSAPAADASSRDRDADGATPVVVDQRARSRGGCFRAATRSGTASARGATRMCCAKSSASSRTCRYGGLVGHRLRARVRAASPGCAGSSLTIAVRAAGDRGGAGRAAAPNRQPASIPISASRRLGTLSRLRARPSVARERFSALRCSLRSRATGAGPGGDRHLRRHGVRRSRAEAVSWACGRRWARRRANCSRSSCAAGSRSTARRRRDRRPRGAGRRPRAVGPAVRHQQPRSHRLRDRVDRVAGGVDARLRRARAAGRHALIR